MRLSQILSPVTRNHSHDGRVYRLLVSSDFGEAFPFVDQVLDQLPLAIHIAIGR